MVSSHVVHTVSSRSLLLATPIKLAKKVPPFFCGSGFSKLQYYTLPAASYFVHSLFLVSSNTRTPDEVPWLLKFMSAPGLAAQLFRSLTEFVSLQVCFTGLPAAFDAFTQSLPTALKTPTAFT